MIFKYRDLQYECESVEKLDNHLIIHTGKYEDNEEIVYQIFGDIDFNDVQIDGGSFVEQPTESEILDARLTYIEMMTGLLEV